jgi:ATP-dependent helicase/nuclease subunit A
VRSAGAAAEAAAPFVTVLRGVIDLVYEQEGGWKLVDYKTDRILIDASELVARYGSQVVRYREAWQRVASGDVLSADLFHVRTLQAARVPPG